MTVDINIQVTTVIDLQPCQKSRLLQLAGNLISSQEERAFINLEFKIAYCFQAVVVTRTAQVA